MPKKHTNVVEMMNSIIAVIEMVVTSPLPSKSSYLHYSYLSITSPSGQTTKKMPFYQALRIIRKQDWELAEVEPVTPPIIPQITRWQALKIVLFGNHD